jgi:stalled ribosome rescue protein Dom34
VRAFADSYAYTSLKPETSIRLSVPRKRISRGYPVAVLVGLENKTAIFWDIFSNSIRPGAVKNWKGNEYNFFEIIVDELRPSIKQGVKTVLLASESKKKYDGFMGHIKKRHGWMLKGYELNRVAFQFVEGSARDVDAVTGLVNAVGFSEKVWQAVEGDTKLVMSVLEKRLASREGIESLMFSLNEVEDAIYGGSDVEYILTSQRFQEQHRRRIQRLFQVAENKWVKTRILPENSPHIGRITQFGGLIGLLKITQNS